MFVPQPPTQVKHEKGTLWKREKTKKIHPNNNNKNTTKEKRREEKNEKKENVCC